MRELIESIVRFSWNMSMLVWRGIGRLFQTRNDLNPLQTAPPFVAQRGPAFNAQERNSASHADNGYRIQSAKGKGNLDVSRLVILGEGLAAGVGDFALHSETQPWSFPAQLARQMGTALSLPLIQPPGIGHFPGFARLSIRIPAPLQTTVFTQLPPQQVSNLAVPGFRLRDAVTLRPVQPLIHRNDARQTAANLVWGILPMAQGKTALPTQLEYAVQQSPTFAIVELGFYEVMEAAVDESLRHLPSPEDFASQYSKIISTLQQAGAEILLLNIPDPFHTAYFSSVETAAKIAKVELSFLTSQYGVKSDDFINLNGLNEIGYQIFGKRLEPLPVDACVSAGFARELRARLSSYNQILSELARRHSVPLYDLAALFQRIASQGCSAGPRVLSSEYLSGFYSLNGYYPGHTGQAIIANEILDFLNRHYNCDFPLIDLNTVLSSDPVAAYRQAGGRSWQTEELMPLCVQSTSKSYPALEMERRTQRNVKSDSAWEPIPTAPKPLLPLQLPPGLEQVLPLSKAASYFGDGISPVNASEPQGIQWGATANCLFGGLAIVDSHLSGSIRIRFTVPVNHVTQFQVDYMDGLTGDDSVLVCPQFFRMPFQHNRVDNVPGTVSSGTLNLETGEVSNLTMYAAYRSAALLSLVNLNSSFPKQPLSFPGQYGSAWAQFEQRPDGKLDFSFYGSTFVPLGDNIVWPLNFSGPDGAFATIPAAGTVMHPHLSLRTKEPEAVAAGACPEIPFNTVQEFTLFTHNSAFGDAFHLNVPHLGGPAKGRSHILGRLQIQFGERCGTSVPFAVWGLPPGGTMSPLSVSPITEAFPGRLSAGPQGFNENLRFPLRTYPLDDLAIIDDPFDISMGAIDLKTGLCLNDLLHRAFISQDLIFALLRVEPRTPKDSFFFRGPALLTGNSRDQSVFRFNGIVHIPYPPGFKFPHPDFATAFTVGGNSALDPFLWFHAIASEEPKKIVKEGSAQCIRSSTGDEFSYKYAIALDQEQTNLFFEYENHTQQGRFKMHSLAWVDVAHSGTKTDNGAYDTMSFSGFGIWSKDGVNTLQQVAVQISTAPAKQYIGIQVASGDVSNVNTKPMQEATALP